MVVKRFSVSSTFTLMCLLFILQLVAWMYITHRPYSVAPPDNTYTVLGKNFYYPSMIYQGKDGAWGVMDTHTTRPTPRVYVEVFFIGLGKVAALFNITPVHMYLISQMIGGLILFAASYWIIHLFVPKSARMFAIVFALGIETGPLLTALSVPFANWEPSFPSHVLVERHFGLPHHTWGEALGLLYLSVLYLTVKHPTPLRIVAMVFLAILATTVLPPYMVTLLLSVCAIWGVWGLATKTLRKLIPPFILSAIAVGAAGVFIRMEFAKGTPWNAWTGAEKSWWTTEKLLTQYGSTLTLFYPCIALALLFALFRWKSWTHQLRLTVLLMAAWVFGPFILVPLSSHPAFPVANFRITDGYQYLPAGILAGIGLWQFISGIPIKILRIGSTISLLGAVLIASLFLSTVFIRQTVNAQNNLWTNVYPLKTTWEGVLFMDTIPKGSGVMVREYFGEIIPGFANVRVFLGGPHGFPDWGERQWLTTRFFSGELQEEEARKLLADNDISYVFYGPDERSLTTSSTFYPSLLVPAFTNSAVTVFRITSN